MKPAPYRKTAAPGPQLGKLRSFAADSGVELGERSVRGLVGLGCFTVIPRCSPLYLVRLWCAGRRCRYWDGVVFLRRASRRRATQTALKTNTTVPAIGQPTEPPSRWVLIPTASNMAPTARPITSWMMSMSLSIFERSAMA